MLADVMERLRQAGHDPKAAGADPFDDELLDDDPFDDDSDSGDDFDDEMPEDDPKAGADSLDDYDDEIPEDEPEADSSLIDDELDDDSIRDDSEGLELEDALRGLDPYEEVFFYVNDLAALADPEAHELIQTAFDEDMVETFLIDRDFVEEQYRRGGEPTREYPDWLERYREQYLKHHTARPSAPPKLLPFPAPRPDRESELRALPQTEEARKALRNTGPALGRNEPCRCGSGKKYKKCHLGKDSRN
jgi:hypothetical protein